MSAPAPSGVDRAWLFLAAIVCAASVPAATLTLDPADRGTYAEYGGHEPAQCGYVAGDFSLTEFRNFFVFDLSQVAAPVTAATLEIYLPVDEKSAPSFRSPDPFETFTLHDVTTDPGSLTSGEPATTVGMISGRALRSANSRSGRLTPAPLRQSSSTRRGCRQSTRGCTPCLPSAAQYDLGSAGDEFVFGGTESADPADGLVRLRLTVLDPLRIDQCAYADGRARFRLVNLHPSVSNRIERSYGIAAPQWAAVDTFASDNPSETWEEPFPPGHSTVFYRARRNPYQWYFVCNPDIAAITIDTFDAATSSHFWGYLDELEATGRIAMDQPAALESCQEPRSCETIPPDRSRVSEDQGRQGCTLPLARG